jgi:thymidylate synthase (FAD)
MTTLATSSNQPVKLLLPDSNDLSEVTLIDWMGNDKAICDAASISYSANSSGRQSTDRDLIRYLMRHWHTTPFEMVEFKFYLKMPIFTARQWIRHRTASINELSGRYSKMPEEFYIPAEFQFQSVANKQGSGGPIPSPQNIAVRTAVNSISEDAFDEYHDMVADPQDGGFGISKEQARMHLPLSTFTEMVWKIDLHNLMHFCRLRTDSHAQEEIRRPAAAIARAIYMVCPLAYEAWVDYQRDARSMSRMEMTLLNHFIGLQDENEVIAQIDAWALANNIGKREKAEARKKLLTVS